MMSVLLMNRYGFEIQTTVPFEATVAALKEAFKAEGFGALCEIDVAGALQEKLGISMGRYTIFGVCNPQLAAEAIFLEPNIGLMMPCNVVVREQGEVVCVAAQDPRAAIGMVGNSKLDSIASEARARIQYAMEELRSRLSGLSAA